MQQSSTKAEDVLSRDLRHAVGAVVTAAAYDAMGDIRVILASREADADCSVDALGILSSDVPRPAREFVPVNF